LTHYLVHPLILAVVLMSIPMLYTPLMRTHRVGPVVFFGLLWLATVGPSALYLVSQRILYPDWKRRIKYLPALMCLGAGVSVSNTLAVLEALCNVASPFVRTPKYGIRRKADTWESKRYGLPATAAVFGELLLGIYSLLSFGLFLFSDKFLPSPFMLIYTAGFFYVFTLSLRHSLTPVMQGGNWR
jgi:hypothetical protein